MPLLTADQKFPQQWGKKPKKVDVMDDGYLGSEYCFYFRNLVLSKKPLWPS